MPNRIRGFQDSRVQVIISIITLPRELISSSLAKRGEGRFYDYVSLIMTLLVTQIIREFSLVEARINYYHSLTP
jgi:hypothetical protein